MITFHSRVSRGKYRVSGAPIPGAYEVLLVPVTCTSIGRPGDTREYPVYKYCLRLQKIYVQIQWNINMNNISGSRPNSLSCCPARVLPAYLMFCQTRTPYVGRVAFRGFPGRQTGQMAHDSAHRFDIYCRRCYFVHRRQSR